MHAHQDRLGLNRDDAIDIDADAAKAKRKVRLGIDHGAVRDEGKLAEFRGQLELQGARDELLAPPAVRHDLLAGAHPQPVFAAKLAKVREPSHRAGFVDDFANHGSGPKASEPSEVNAALSVTSADKHTALAGPQAIDMTLAADEVVGPGKVINGDLDRPGAI